MMQCLTIINKTFSVLFLVFRAYCILEEEYVLIDTFRLENPHELPSMSVVHCSALCSRLQDNCCLFNFDSQSERCFWTSNCLEIRSVVGGKTFKRKSTTEPPKHDCSDVVASSGSGVYRIVPQNNGGKEINVFCDMLSDGGGWTVIQRRVSGATSFYRQWSDYKIGFGNLEENFWLGNDKIHAIVNQRTYKIRFDLEDNNGETAYAEYSTFNIDDEIHKYRLSIDGFSGNAGDAILIGSEPYYHNLNGMSFSTLDQDNDMSGGYNCADDLNKCGWWINACTKANLNGVYNSTDTSSEPPDKIYWYNWKGHEELKRVEIKVKPTTLD